MKRLVVILFGLAAFLGCREVPEIGLGGAAGDLISFGVEPIFSAETKAAEVTSLESFYVSAVTGEPGSEVSDWTSTRFSLVPASDPATYTANRYWPMSDPSYSFYASNRPLTFNAGGTTVSATNEEDVVCAYRSGSTYKSRNTLTFEHIFARLGKVTVAAVPGYDLVSVDIRLTPQTGGTYNLRTREWADVITGTATTIANAVGENANDLWMVPGDYTLTASWVARDMSGSTVSYSGKTTLLTIKEGAVNSVGIVLGGNITVGVDIKQYVDYESLQNQEPLTFEALGNGRIYWKTLQSSWVKTIEYSKDDGETWTSIDSSPVGAIIPVSTGDKVLVRGNNTAYGESSSSYCYFSANVDYCLYGNLTDLLANGYKVLLEPYCFYKLFYANDHLYNHETKKIQLPSQVMAPYCYYYLFYQSNLTEAPELPACTLADYCYSYMFYKCSGLTRAPQLPATKLASHCYEYMFTNCSGLTEAPELPATELADYCYNYMFSYCTSLAEAPELPATTITPYCYNGMFQNTALTTAPELPATTLRNGCYRLMFDNCTGLTAAPVLPAASLSTDSYSMMFRGCSSLNYIKALFTSTPGTGVSYEWVSGVAETGTFVKSKKATWSRNDSHGVPPGWTILTE